ncbi:MAG: hypothetical protein QM311_02470 [Acidobacteriota bacterium]|nr:hypothetical protein [Acidobacteriota bacterium]
MARPAATPPPDSETPRGSPPAAGAWRGEALAPSAHGRFAALAAPPRDDFDSARATALCADVCRAALGSLAPALTLLPPTERRRAQAVAAFALTLFDFARQRGVDGDRLAQINRWEFTLEAALGGERIGQPIFLRLGEEQRRRPFSTAGLDALFAAARGRATVERPSDPAEAAERRELVARGLVLTLIGDGASPATVEFAAGLLGIQALLTLGTELAGGRCPLPVSELPSILPAPPAVALATAVAAESRRLQPLLLRGARAVREVPLTFRRAGAFLVLASTRLLARVEEAGPSLLRRPPRLGASERLRLVLRSRWGRLARG